VLTLAPLEAAEQSALLTSGLGLSREVADEVVRLTRGNPLFAVQLMSDWVTRGALELSAQGYVARDGAPLQLPDDLHHVWRLRLEHLLDGEADREHARRSLELAAALGHEVAWHEWRYASQQAGLVLSAGLVDRMVELGLTRRSPRSMAFVHGLLHESVTRTSREAGRWAGLHRICAQMLSAMYPERQPGLMGRLAEHWWQAGDMEAALPALYLAMDYAADMGDYDGVDMLLARHARAMDALGLPAEHPHRCRHLGQRGSQHHRRRDHDAGFALQEQAAEIARRHGWGDELALALRRMGLALVSLDKPERAQPLLEEARAIFERRGDADNLLRTLGAMVSACRRRRWRDEAVALMAQLEGLEARLGYTQAAAHAYLDMSFLLSNLGDLDGALRYLEIAQERADRLGSRNMVSWCLNARGDLARLLDDHEQALDAYERALHIDRRYFPAQVPVLMLNVAMLHAERGAWEQALAALPEVERALLARTNHDSFFIHTNLVRLCCGAALERWEVWDQGAAELSQRCPRPDAVYRELALMADRAARLAHAAGDPTRAAYAAQLAREQWHALTSLTDLGRR
jgi:tetratricopeptide (TPR) repeat protein